MPGVCYVQNAMLCLQCRRWQPKSAWSPAQWKSLKCVLLDLQRNCCSDCSSDWWCSAPNLSDSGRDPEPGWAQSLLVVLRVASTDKLIQRTYRLATLGRHISDFMTHWVDNLGRQYRKLLSHSGALRYRQGVDGCISGKGAWTDPVSRQRYFDPGNDIYSRAFHLAFPDIAETSGWNAETQGDIFEGFLALRCLDDYGAVRKHPGYPHFPPEGPAARIAAWIDELVTLVWAVCLIHPVTESPAEWARRWVMEIE